MLKKAVGLFMFSKAAPIAPMCGKKPRVQHRNPSDRMSGNALPEGFFVVLVAIAIRQSLATTSIYLIEIIANVCPPER